ncbi:zinc-dependent alcohol dehydrogenase [Desulfofundulus thermocisternus]|uniref:zinc-dependent alcohol dehydrogenase n=1 Tax=Desulfofundulus thermocisternus TaxID=42471 RepID=UPI000480A4E2|nr:alcohol dehydrogenase catalytic domain-containing protein [Desulfofundulus thermocisternus]
MKALVKKSTKQYDIELTDLQIPSLKDDEVLIKVTASSICGSDLHMYLGHEGYRWINYPVVLGHEVVGVVEAAGSGVEPDIVGKRVVINPYIPCNACDNCLKGEENICQAGPRTLTAPPLSLQFGFRRNGGMAEYMVVPRDNALPLGNKISDEVAAILESVAVGVHAVNKIGDVKNKNIVIFGPGPIGLGIAVICKGLGSGKTLVAGLPDDEERLQIVKKIKAIPVRVDPADFSALAGHLQDRPADVVFDCSGHPSVPEKAMYLVKKGGKVILVGISTGRFSLPMDCMVRGEIGLKGTYGTSKKSFLQAIEYAGLPQFPFEHIVTDRFRLAEAVAAFDLASNKKRGKILLYP